ncbi:V-type H+-transporting ATPase subunit d [Nematocida sp. AWRm77]|nr:V-type H+-transporting ATPase subunit d [Nematocida sp. AWRm77]
MYDEAGIISYVHGSKDQLMTLEDYKSMRSCASIEDLKIKLYSSFYGKHMLEEPQTTPKAFRNVLYKCIEEQMQFTLGFSTPKTKKLIDFYKESFQLNNFIYLWACKKESAKSLDTSLDTHPLGDYDGLSFIKVTQDSEDTWKFCLENTPLQKYITGLSHEILNGDVQYITNILQKRYIELLYEFSVENNLSLAGLMQFEGDKQIIEILHSTMGSSIPGKDKLALFPSCSTFSDMHKAMFIACETIDDLKGALSTHKTYRGIIGNEMGMEDALRKEEIRICKSTFLYYDDPSVVYTLLKLQELEISNLIFLSECIVQGRAESVEEILDMEES